MNEFKQIFNKGLTNSTLSFSQIFSNEITFQRMHEGLHVLEDEDSLEFNFNPSQQESSIYTMKFHGEIDGKCYLILSKTEFDTLCQLSYGKNFVMNDVKEEFVKEFTNVLAWAVLSSLTHDLKIKVFSEPPELTKTGNLSLPDAIYDDFSEFTDEVYLNISTFSLKDNETFHPRFVWVLDCDTVQQIQEKISV